jgi:hypothetical protein
MFKQADHALKMCVSHPQPELSKTIKTFYAEGALNNVLQFPIFYYSPKVANPWRLFGIKITRIDETKNLTRGYL